MLTFSSGAKSNTALLAKIGFIEYVVARERSEEINDLLASASLRVNQPLQVEFHDKETAEADVAQGVIRLPKNLDLEDTIYELILMLCLIDQDPPKPSDFKSAKEFSNAAATALYEVNQRQALLIVQFYQNNKENLLDLMQALQYTDFDFESEKGYFQKITQQSFAEYHALHKNEETQFEDHWQAAQDLFNDLNRLIEQRETLTLEQKITEKRTKELRKLMKEARQVERGLHGLKYEITEIFNTLEDISNRYPGDPQRAMEQIDAYLKSLDLNHHKAAPSTYLFAQQMDASCMLMPFLNLPLLAEQQKRDGGLKHFDRKWHTKEKWLIKTFPALRDWHRAMRQLSFPSSPESDAFAQYQRELLTNGLVKEKIKKLNTSEGLYVKKDPQDLMRANFTPYTTSLQEKFPMLTKTVPLFYDKGGFYCYDPELKGYLRLEPMAQTLDHAKPFPLSILNIPEHLMEYYNFQPHQLLWPTGKLLGREQGYKVSYIDHDNELLLNQNVGYFYSTGLYHLMLFAMGLDRDNQVIDDGHVLFPAYQQFRQVMAEYPDNPWQSVQFKKENLLQYHIADILRENPSLKDKLKQSLSSFTAWPYYEQLNDVIGGEEYKLHLPGEELMLAYALSQNLKYLWAISLSNEKLAAVLDLGNLPKEVAAQINVEEMAQKIKTEAVRTGEDGQSLMDHWGTLRALLQARVGQNANLVSFDGHGSIKSFSPNVCRYQQQQGLADESLFTKLGFTEVDSYYQEGRQPFYQRTPEEARKMDVAAKTIQSFWRLRRNPVSSSGAATSGVSTSHSVPSSSTDRASPRKPRA